MKCLVLGGAGFLGSYLCKYLVDKGYNVILFDKNQPDYSSFNDMEDKIEVVINDFVEIECFDELTKNVDVVFHLISTTVPRNSNQNMGFDMESNVLPTLKLLNSCKKNDVKKVIFFSSGGTVYGITNNIPISEDHSTDPICSYGIHKLTIEKYLQLYWYLYRLDFVIMRISNPYGERQFLNASQGVVTTFLERALSNEPIYIWGDGTIIRDYIHVSDVARAAFKLIDYKGKYKVFNIGNGEGHSLNQICAQIETVLEREIKVNYEQAKKEDVPINVLDIKRAISELDWEPRVSLQEGIQLLIEDWSELI